MSQNRRRPPKNKPLPKAPSKALPKAPSKPRKNHYNPRSNTNSTTHTYTFQTNLNGSYTNHSSSRNGGNGGFTYSTTYYTSAHPWAQPSKPLKKLPNKIAKTPPVSNHSSHTHNPYTVKTRAKRAMTLDTDTHNKHTKRTSYHNALPLNPTIVNLNMEYCINDSVDLNDNRQGIIRFIGEIAVELNGAVWYGIQLKKAQGNCDGTLKGISYFKCAENYGTFVEQKSIRWLTSSAANDTIDLESTDRLHINQIVGVKRKKGKGQIRFIGLYKNELKYGIELLDDMGVHSGVVDGKFYFTSGIFRGLFVSRTDLIHLDYYEHNEMDTLHGRSTQNIFTNLPAFNDNNTSFDSSDSESDLESVASTDTVMTVDDETYNTIQLNEMETEMAFAQIFNKFKNVERTQPRPSKLMPLDATKQFHANNDIQNAMALFEDNPKKGNSTPKPSLNLSQTSDVVNASPIIEDYPDTMALYTIESSIAEIESDTEAQIETLNPNPPKKKLSIVVGMHNSEKESEFKMMEPTANTAILQEIEDETETEIPSHTPEIPTKISTEQMDMSEMKPSTARSSAMAVPMPATEALMSLSPLGMGGGFSSHDNTPGHSPQMSLNLDEDVLINIEDSHLKEMPDSPYDVNTTEREFANTANVMKLGCDHPQKLFKILKAMTVKLYSEDMKYRLLSAKSHRMRQKLLKYKGVEEFLHQLGFRETDNGDKLKCPLDQPPISVLDASINVCTDFIQKCSRQRGVIENIKRFNPTQLHSVNELDLAALINENGLESSNNTPLPMMNADSGGAMLQPMTPLLSQRASRSAEVEQIVIDQTLALIEDGNDDCKNEGSEDEEELEEEMEDTFKLFDIIASITHEQNYDNSARQIILLCYTTFTDGVQMLNCLERRFCSEPTQWSAQTKVISFVQSWMRQYWSEDWANTNDSYLLIDALNTFFEKIKQSFCRNDEESKKYLKLIEMLQKTMKFQRANVRKQSLSQSPHSQYSVTQILNMPSIRGAVDKEQLFNDKIYDFFKLNNVKMARQITFLDQTYFGNIKARECLGQAWKKQNKLDIAANICAFIDHFNRVSKWVQTRILLCANAKKRGRTIKKFIKICEQLFVLRNFNSLYAVHSALYSSPIQRLKKAWHYISTKHLAKFEEFKVIFSSKKNMRNLRKLHRETCPPMIPYTGIILQDLLQIEEGNKKRKEDGAVNFARLLRLSTVIDSVLLHQKTQYKINLDSKLQQLIKIELSKNQHLSDDYCWKLSDKAKKIDSSKKGNFMKFGAK